MFISTVPNDTIFLHIHRCIARKVSQMCNFGIDCYASGQSECLSVATILLVRVYCAAFCQVTPAHNKPCLRVGYDVCVSFVWFRQQHRTYYRNCESPRIVTKPDGTGLGRSVLHITTHSVYRGHHCSRCVVSEGGTLGLGVLTRRED